MLVHLPMLQISGARQSDNDCFGLGWDARLKLLDVRVADEAAGHGMSPLLGLRH